MLNCKIVEIMKSAEKLPSRAFGYAFADFMNSVI